MYGCELVVTWDNHLRPLLCLSTPIYRKHSVPGRIHKLLYPQPPPQKCTSFSGKPLDFVSWSPCRPLASVETVLWRPMIKVSFGSKNHGQSRILTSCRRSGPAAPLGPGPAVPAVPAVTGTVFRQVGPWLIPHSFAFHRPG